MKFRKNIIVLGIIATTLTTLVSSYYIGNAQNKYDEICHVYNTSELTDNILTNRQGKLIIEKCVGNVIDNNKNGELENVTDCNYISYAHVKCKKGDTVITYLIYNPETNYIDDVIERYDFVQDK